MVDSWDLLKRIYKDRFNVEPILVDYIAVSDILYLCAEGKSNKEISLALDFDEEYIQSVLKQFFRFDGFIQDVAFNVRNLYRKNKYNRYCFLSTARFFDRETTEALLKEGFRVNIIMDVIEKEIENFYARE
jgi:hypothetical protein